MTACAGCHDLFRTHRRHPAGKSECGTCRRGQPKKSHTRAKNFGKISVELDAIEPDLLRSLVQDAIEQHLPTRQFEILKAAEESERKIISRLVRKVAS